MSLVMIHANDGVEFLLAHRHVEDSVGRKWTLDRHALAARPLHGGAYLADLFIAEQPVLARMRIEAGHGDPRVRYQLADGFAGEGQYRADALFFGARDGFLERNVGADVRHDQLVGGEHDGDV